MHPRMQELLDFVDEQYAGLLAAADAVPPEHREQQPAEGCWSVAQVVDHVSRVERMAGGLIERMVAEARERGAGGETPTGSVVSQAVLAKTSDRTTRRNAPEPAHPAPDARFDEARAALEAAHRRVVDVLASGDGLALEAVQMPHPALGMLNTYEWGVAVGGHAARHTAQIQEVAATLAAAPAAR